MSSNGVGGDHGRFASDGSVVGPHRGCCKAGVLSDVEHTSGNRSDRAKVRVVGRAMANLFATNRILLGGEGELAKGGSEEFSFARSVDIETSVSNEEFDIAHAEGCMVFTLGAAIFPRSHEKEKADDDHISSTESRCLGSGIAQDAMHTMLNDGDRNGLQTTRWRIRFRHVA